MNRNNDLHASMVEPSGHTGVVIACFDAFGKTRTKKTVVVIDNAFTTGHFSKLLCNGRLRG